MKPDRQLFDPFVPKRNRLDYVNTQTLPDYENGVVAKAERRTEQGDR